VCAVVRVAYPASTRHVEELMQERGVSFDHATGNRWVIKYSPPLEEAFHRRKRPAWLSWWMDETYIKVKEQWYYLYRAVDKTGQTIQGMQYGITALRDAMRSPTVLERPELAVSFEELNALVGFAELQACERRYTT
jgi:putative transposase